MNEFELIKKYFVNLANKSKKSLNLNDDIFFDKNNGLAISIDTYNEGVHFINFKKPELVIKKIIRSSISDLICKGVEPRYYFISASGNKETFTNKNLRKINKSLTDEQKKYNIILGGGDTVYSKNLNFTITSIGFAKTIVQRNNAKNNDDIYVTGNLGDSFVGLQVLKKKININKKLSKYFINEYYKPRIKYSLAKNLNIFASSSIDLSDGLVSDLEKMLNNHTNSYLLYMDKIPVSRNLSLLINLKKLSKKNIISKGDDFQILFTSNRKNRKLIRKVSIKKNIKITRIGKILSSSHKSSIIDRNGSKIKINNKGYLHRFE